MGYYYVLKFFALVTTFYSLFPCSISHTTKLGNEPFVAFVKEPHNFEQFCEEKLPTESKWFLAQFYATHLGILHHMRKNWHSDSFRRQKCEKYHEYLDILYEYFFKVYAGHNVVRPIFVVREIFRPIREMELVKVVAHFAATKNHTNVEHQKKTKPYAVVENLAVKSENYVMALKIELQNETELVNDKSNVKETSEQEKVEEKVKRNKFEKIMEKMLKKLEEKAMEKEEIMAKERKGEKASSEAAPSSALPSVDIYDFISDFPTVRFDVMPDWDKEAKLIGFLKRAMKPDINNTYKNTKNERRFLVHLYLMKKIWQCEKLPKHNLEYPTDAFLKYKCEKNLQFVNILYEYFFRVRYGIAAVRPLFGECANRWRMSLSLSCTFKSSIKQLTAVLESLDHITKCYFRHCLIYPNQEGHYGFEITLLNQEELNYTANSKNEIPNISFQEILKSMSTKGAFQMNDEDLVLASVGNQMKFPFMQELLRKVFKAELQSVNAKWGKKKRKMRRPI